MGAFTHVKINPKGAEVVAKIEDAFIDLHNKLNSILIHSREAALVKTKLQEACFWAKKAVCELPENQAASSDP